MWVAFLNEHYVKKCAFLNEWTEVSKMWVAFLNEHYVKKCAFLNEWTEVRAAPPTGQLQKYNCGDQK